MNFYFVSVKFFNYLYFWLPWLSYYFIHEDYIHHYFYFVEKKVSFSVKFKAQTGCSATIYEKSTIVRFKIVDYNEGEGYNETTGIFTVPVAGVYHFIFFVQGWHEGDNVSCPDAIVGLYIDGNAMAGAVADPKHEKQFDTGGNTYTNYLSKGQKVLIGTGSNCEQHVICGHRTSFSGHLLY